MDNAGLHYNPDQLHMKLTCERLTVHARHCLYENEGCKQMMYVLWNCCCQVMKQIADEEDTINKLQKDIANEDQATPEGGISIEGSIAKLKVLF